MRNLRVMPPDGGPCDIPFLLRRKPSRQNHSTTSEIRRRGRAAGTRRGISGSAGGFEAGLRGIHFALERYTREHDVDEPHIGSQAGMIGRFG
jgi:hypothetical protein